MNVSSYLVQLSCENQQNYSFTRSRHSCFSYYILFLYFIFHKMLTLDYMEDTT